MNTNDGLAQSQQRARYNTLVDKILEAKKQVGEGLYNIGLYLIEIKKKNLFNVEFEAFDTFLEKRVSIPRSTAFDAIKIAHHFSLIDWQKFGYKKCRLLLKIEKSDMSDFTKPLTNETTSREIKEKVTEYQIEKGVEDTQRGVEGIKPKKKPISSGNQEDLYKLRRDLLNLIDAMKQHKVNKDNIMARYQIIKENCSKHLDFYDLKDRLAEANKLKDEI